MWTRLFYEFLRVVIFSDRWPRSGLRPLVNKVAQTTTISAGRTTAKALNWQSFICCVKNWNFLPFRFFFLTTNCIFYLLGTVIEMTDGEEEDHITILAAATNNGKLSCFAKSKPDIPDLDSSIALPLPVPPIHTQLPNCESRPSLPFLNTFLLLKWKSTSMHWKFLKIVYIFSFLDILLSPGGHCQFGVSIQNEQIFKNWQNFFPDLKSKSSIFDKCSLHGTFFRQCVLGLANIIDLEELRLPQFEISHFSCTLATFIGV